MQRPVNDHEKRSNFKRKANLRERRIEFVRDFFFRMNGRNFSSLKHEMAKNSVQSSYLISTYCTCKLVKLEYIAQHYSNRINSHSLRKKTFSVFLLKQTACLLLVAKRKHFLFHWGVETSCTLRIKNHRQCR